VITFESSKSLIASILLSKICRSQATQRVSSYRPVCFPVLICLCECPHRTLVTGGRPIINTAGVCPWHRQLERTRRNVVRKWTRTPLGSPSEPYRQAVQRALAQSPQSRDQEGRLDRERGCSHCSDAAPARQPVGQDRKTSARSIGQRRKESLPCNY
jgi:hypothetical protein